jgi:hypothetical protein
MGLDVHAKLVVGLSTIHALKVETRETTVKKFNENTGEPYAKPVSSKVITILGKEFPLNENFQLDFALETIHPELECFHYNSDNYSDYNIDRIIGFEVATMGGRCETSTRQVVTQGMIHHAIEEFRTKFGRDGMLFLTMEYSY